MFKRGDRDKETKVKLSAGEELEDQEIAGKPPDCGGGRMWCGWCDMTVQ